MDFLSIIIPAYNAERWLDRCLRSVCAVADADCEIIVVNDGSTDSTREIARGYVDNDPRMTMVDIEHCGPCAARKAGFLESQGNYIMFVDSDDVLPLDSIREQRRMLSEYAMDGAEDNSRCATAKPLMVLINTVVRSPRGNQLLLSGPRRAITGKEYAHEILTGAIPGFLSGHLYARELLEAIEWDDNPSITHHEHHYLLLSMTKVMERWDPNGRFVLIDPSLVGYTYLRRAGSQSAMMSLTQEGLERIWTHLCTLDLPAHDLTIWGLRVIRDSFINRGIPFSNSFKVAADLRDRVRELDMALPQSLREAAESLISESKRAKIARRLSRTGALLSVSPHLSFVMVCHGNISKVERSLASIFRTGLRNLEVILVDYDNSYNDSVAINSLCITYPRVRVVKCQDAEGVFSAARQGLAKVEGLCVTFIRPGDLVNAQGIYDAVTRVDYGADVVLVNHRHFSTVTRIRNTTHSYAYLRSTEEQRKSDARAADATENVYEAAVQALTEIPSKSEAFNIYGVIWRRSVLQETGLDSLDFDSLDRASISHKALRRLLERPLRVVTQDKHTTATYEFATDSLIKHAVTGRLAFLLI